MPRTQGISQSPAIFPGLPERPEFEPIPRAYPDKHAGTTSRLPQRAAAGGTFNLGMPGVRLVRRSGVGRNPERVGAR